MPRHPLPMLLLLSCTCCTSIERFGQGEFVTVSGLQLFVGQEPFRYLGCNIYWLMAEASYGEQGRANVAAALDDAVSLGVSVVRTWAFADGPGSPHLQPLPGVFDEATFAALDFVVAEAKARKLRLLLPLLNHWTDYGGISAYSRWDVPAREWAPGDACPAFYRSPVSRAQYKAMATTVTSRVSSISGVAMRDEPAIFAWELCNECRCRGEAGAAPLAAWYAEMASFVKRLAPRQLLAAGSEGLYSPPPDADAIAAAFARVDAGRPPNHLGGMNESECKRLNPSDWYMREGVSFMRDSAAPDIDLATYHLHDSDWCD
jgi:mannan endo-1,4-beta-mannosidase